MTLPKIAFAVPGKINTRTGGTIYDRRVIEELRRAGSDVTHIELPSGFPFPSEADLATSLALLTEVPADVPLVIDGLAFGALGQVDSLTAPLYPLVHHPLAEESGLSAVQRQHLFETERQNLRHARHILVPSPHTGALLTKAYGVAPDDITIARPGTDRPTMAPAPTKPPLILSVGIQLPRKGHDVLLHALAQIQDLAWEAVIAGTALDPDYTRRLTDLCTQLDLQHRVTLAGEVSRAALDTLYAKASLFALASRYEGYGIVFDEALVRGLPIVASGAGAVSDTVPQDAGVVVPPDAPEAFANALRQMLSEPAFLHTKAQAAARAGQALPSWADTAATFAAALTR